MKWLSKDVKTMVSDRRGPLTRSELPLLTSQSLSRRPAAPLPQGGVGNRKSGQPINSMQNITSLYQRIVKRSMDWSLGVKTRAKLAGMALRAIPLIFGHLTAAYVKVVWVFATRVSRLYKKTGYKGVAIYLKTCYLLLQHFVGGQIDPSPWSLGCNVSRTRRGLPRIIPLVHRREISAGKEDVIRLWLTLLGLYRVLPFKGTLKLKTITAPGKDITSILSEFKGYVPTFLGLASKLNKRVSWELDPSRDLAVRSMPAITKSGPNSHGFSSMAGFPLDVITWWLDPPMRDALVRWLTITESNAFLHDLLGLFNGLSLVTDRWIRSNNKSRKLTPYEFLTASKEVVNGRIWIKALWGKPLLFGKLGFKEEPGKIRVFAMVNLLTQALMRPLHEWLFERLRIIPTDGTFDQVAPVELLVKRFVGTEYVASFDLSAATDRLPVAIQIALLEPLLGSEMASLWAGFLVSRPYGLPRIAKSYNLGFNKVYYAVGQPMGALSSWAMLAMTHHAIVQWAAKRARPKSTVWFLDYALLGDDIVIADKAVAQEYLFLMDALGVEVGLAKSLVSHTGSLEFAKRTWVKGRSVTPFSLAEMSVAVSNIGALEELWRKTLPFGSPIRLAAVARFCGFGYKNLARLPVVFSLNNRLSRLAGYLHRPGGIIPLSFETWVASPGPGVMKGLPFLVQRKIVASLVVDVLDLIERVLERAKGEINRAFATKLFSATHKVRGKVDTKTAGNRKQIWVTKDVYGPVFIGMFEEYASLFERFFKEWVLYSYSKPISFKASSLTVRLREFRKSKSTSGFNSLESTWRWITDLETGLAALPTQIDLFSREDDVRVRPSALIKLWIRLRRKCIRELRKPEE